MEMATLNLAGIILLIIVVTAKTLFVTYSALLSAIYFEHLIFSRDEDESDFSKLVAWAKNKLFIIE